MSPFLKQCARWLIRHTGTRVKDEQTGVECGRAWIWSWGGKVHVWGLETQNLVPFFLPNDVVQYGRQNLGFYSHPQPDVPSLLPSVGQETAAILFVILVHQSADVCDKILARWNPYQRDRHRILGVHGGRREDFEAWKWPSKIYVEDARLRTQIHPVERQSYSAVMTGVAEWLQDAADQFTHIALFEWDHLPLAPQLPEFMLNAMQAEGSDLMAGRLIRVDGTNHGNWLPHVREARSHGWPSGSRVNDSTVLSMMMTGTLWRREAWESVARQKEPFPIYNEIWLPTTAHHQGARVRPWPDAQQRFVRADALSAKEIAEGKRSPAWSLHPVKQI